MADYNEEQRVAAGYRWYREFISRKVQEEIDPDNLRDWTMLQLLASALKVQERQILRFLDLSMERAQQLGLWHLAAGGKEYSERSSREDREVNMENDRLSKEWRKKLKAGNRSFEEWLHSTYPDTKSWAHRPMYRNVLQEAYSAGKEVK